MDSLPCLIISNYSVYIEFTFLMQQHSQLFWEWLWFFLNRNKETSRGTKLPTAAPSSTIIDHVVLLDEIKSRIEKHFFFPNVWTSLIKESSLERDLKALTRDEGLVQTLIKPWSCAPNVTRPPHSPTASSLFAVTATNKGGGRGIKGRICLAVTFLFLFFFQTDTSA